MAVTVYRAVLCFVAFSLYGCNSAVKIEGNSTPALLFQNQNYNSDWSEVVKDDNQGQYHDNTNDNARSVGKDNTFHGLPFWPSALPVVERTKQFLRNKRSTCQSVVNLPQNVRELNVVLTPSSFIGLDPTDSVIHTVPPNQPDQCPDIRTNTWWPRRESNLRSTCPWKIVERDLGENAFPRFIQTAKCLCTACIGSSALRCAEINQVLTYFYCQGCQNGLAIMEKRSITVAVGCHCTAAAPPNQQNKQSRSAVNTD